MKLTPAQKEVIAKMRTGACIMDLKDGYYYTGGSGRVDGRVVKSLNKMGLLSYQTPYRLTDLGKTIEI